MSFNKISGLSSLPAPALPVSLPAGAVFMLPVGQGAPNTFGNVALPQIGTGNPLTGQYIVNQGQYSNLQVYDASLQYWRNLQPAGNQSLITVSADGANYRLANTTGCPIGALITNNGTGLTNGFNTVTVTPSAGGSVWNTLVGGAINSTITITNGGSGFLAAPTLVFSPPAGQGSTPYVLPTATCTISGGVINAVTVVNQGAGLVAAPTLTVVNAPGDTVGGGAVLTVNATLALSGLLLAMWPRAINTTTGAQQAAPYGTPLTSVPTFTFSPASTIAATAIMNFTITGFTSTTAGVGYVAAGGVIGGGVVSGTAGSNSPGNPMLDKLLINSPVAPPITVAATTGVPSLAGPFQGVGYQAVPTYSAFSTGAAPSTAAVQPPTVGGASDTCLIMSI